jgi:hypothetical protein
MTTLVVPGVRVEARFDVLPPLPAQAGILGAVGIVDRPPADGRLVGISRRSEIAELLGPGTEASMPEIVHAISNGISEILVAGVEGGSRARLALLNADGDDAVMLTVRSPGAWANALRAEVLGVPNSAGNLVRVTIRLQMNGTVVEQFDDLQILPGAPDHLFDVINTLSRYVVATDAGFADSLPADGTFNFNGDGDPIPVTVDGGAANFIELLPVDGVDPNGLSVVIDTDAGTTDVQILQGGLKESYTDLNMDPDSERYLPFVLLQSSSFVRVRVLSSFVNPNGTVDVASALPALTPGPQAFTPGTSPTVAQYQAAIERLADDTRIDLILASVEPTRANGEVHQIHQALVSHAVTQADNGAPRIAFGSITPDEQNDLDRIRDHSAAVRNRRFVLVSPAGAHGAVAGMIGRLPPHFSPTFKTVPLHGIPPATYRESQLNRLLGPTTNLLVVQDRPGRGVIVLKGINTIGDQISVSRVADLCIRETKAIAENFIGLLNTEDARIALRQQLIATFTRFERDNALVPSTDGTDPAFLVDVYSTQTDFAQGIVRIDIAVRPVRAIDYIYATIRVKN